MSLHRKMFGRNTVIGRCWICRGEVHIGKVEYVLDPFAALKSGTPPKRKCHKGECAERARRYIERLAPPLFDSFGPLL